MTLKLRAIACRGRQWNAGLVAGTAVALAVAVACCNAINPSLVGTIGVNATTTVQTLPGNVVVVFMNRTTFPARLNFSTLEEEGITNLNQIDAGATDFIASAFTCNLTTVTITGVDVRVDIDFVAVDMQAVDLIGGISYRCGSVISVLLEGVPDNFTVRTQVF